MTIVDRVRSYFEKHGVKSAAILREKPEFNKEEYILQAGEGRYKDTCTMPGARSCVASLPR